MPGILADVPAVWFAIAIVSTMFLGVSLEFPTTAPEPASPVADTIDRVAGNPYDSTATHPVTATAIRFQPHRVAIRTPSGVSHATLLYGPVTPAPRDSRLEQVAKGTPPAILFESEDAFHAAVTAAQDSNPIWRTGVDSIIVRQVTWGETNVTIVTA